MIETYLGIRDRHASALPGGGGGAENTTDELRAADELPPPPPSQQQQAGAVVAATVHVGSGDTHHTQQQAISAASPGLQQPLLFSSMGTGVGDSTMLEAARGGGPSCSLITKESEGVTAADARQLLTEVSQPQVQRGAAASMGRKITAAAAADSGRALLVRVSRLTSMHVLVFCAMFQRTKSTKSIHEYRVLVIVLILPYKRPRYPSACAWFLGRQCWRRWCRILGWSSRCVARSMRQCSRSSCPRSLPSVTSPHVAQPSPCCIR